MQRWRHSDWLIVWEYRDRQLAGHAILLMILDPDYPDVKDFFVMLANLEEQKKKEYYLPCE